MFHVHVSMCMFARVHDHRMSEMEFVDPQIDDEQIVKSKARVRFLLLQRMETIWRQVEDNLDPERGADPRWAEIGVRLLDRYARLYQLDKPKPVTEEEDDLGAGVDRRQLVLQQLSELRDKSGLDGEGS
jgi:hypothetical protein